MEQFMNFLIAFWLGVHFVLIPAALIKYIFKDF